MKLCIAEVYCFLQMAKIIAVNIICFFAAGSLTPAIFTVIFSAFFSSWRMWLSGSNWENSFARATCCVCVCAKCTRSHTPRVADKMRVAKIASVNVTKWRRLFMNNISFHFSAAETFLDQHAEFYHPLHRQRRDPRPWKTRHCDFIVNLK